uniref:Polygalacturonase-inhibitor protein n=1 Tax=Musa AAB Group TaxID=485264 RepID=E5FQ60_MUSPR|nr:polygalacturonase-inhibitor protein [Musa AAB Group]
MSNTSLLSLFFFLSLCISPSLSDLCNPNDKRVLLNFKKALNNPYVLASWNPKTDCCDWYCVQCHSKTNRIHSLTIFAGDLPGKIPAAVGDLPYLETLTLRKLPSLSGPIQPAIAKLKNLKYVTISWTNISGPIPDFLSQLTKLSSLDLSFNSLSGSIPSSLSKLPNLDSVHLDRNKLTGPIPESFGRFRMKNTQLFLSHNQLSGKIPASFGNMNFGSIDLSRNRLEGDASLLFWSKKTTTSVVLSRNMLEFDLSKVQFPKSLVWLDLNHNKIFRNHSCSKLLPLKI